MRTALSRYMPRYVIVKNMVRGSNIIAIISSTDGRAISMILYVFYISLCLKHILLKRGKIYGSMSHHAVSILAPTINDFGFRGIPVTSTRMNRALRSINCPVFVAQANE